MQEEDGSGLWEARERCVCVLRKGGGGERGRSRISGGKRSRRRRRRKGE